jgi:thioredoxin-like negative regulator of GroEL
MNETDGTKLYFFNIEQDKDFVVNEMGIRSVPTIKGFSGGKEVYHSTGVLREEQIKSVASQIL